MPNLTVMRGLPGSGKSTQAHYLAAHGGVRLNRDDLRKSLFNAEGILSFDKENLITQMQRDLARAALQAGKHVIVDDTNLRQKYVRAWNEFAIDHGAKFLVWTMFTPVDVCVERDSARERTVGEDVIREMAQKFLKDGVLPEYEYVKRTPVEKVEWDTSLPNVVMVDIDGTMALMGDRSPYDWKAVSQDAPNRAVVDLVSRLLLRGDYVVFLSGRDGSCRADTLTWLRAHLPRGYDSRWWLLMREAGDNRRDDIVKREIFDREIRGYYNVDFVLDDRDQVVRMWRSLGLTCLQVAEGNF